MMIVGIDEVGRGPWAGPLVVGAVVLDTDIPGLTDSKKLTKKKREMLNVEIIDKAQAVGLGWVHAYELDEIGLPAALTLACKRALSEVHVPYHEIIIDGTVNFLKDTRKGPYVTTLKKADLLVPSVSAASIVAKVARDEYMSRQHELYPEYGFDGHVGYGTAAHKAALEQHGVTPLHRKSFAPIAQLLGNEINTYVKPSREGTTRGKGDESETIASEWLAQNGFSILERNWRIKLCEIDIVAQKKGAIYFVEVKHRKNQAAGSGTDAITAKKQRQMRFAANMYIHWNNLYGADVRLAMISTTGESPVFEHYLELE